MRACRDFSCNTCINWEEAARKLSARRGRIRNSRSVSPIIRGIRMKLFVRNPDEYTCIKKSIAYKGLRGALLEELSVWGRGVWILRFGSDGLEAVDHCACMDAEHSLIYDAMEGKALDLSAKESREFCGGGGAGVDIYVEEILKLHLYKIHFNFVLTVHCSGLTSRTPSNTALRSKPC